MPFTDMPAPMQAQLPDHIEHVVVLMLENRSFDHMLGYLPHPDPSFDGLKKERYDPGHQPAETTMNARYAIYPGPDHSHRGSMHQLLGTEDIPSGANSYAVTNGGFVANYEKRLSEAYVNAGYGKKVMRCFNPAMVPVLSALALEYAVCDRWFCSGPMQTLPNRDFLHAGTSFGRVGNAISPRDKYKTIFHRLQQEGKSWRLYHRNVAHLWTYPALFGRNQSKSHDAFFSDIEDNELPTYSLIEPDYGDVTHTGIGRGESQHPSQADSLEEFVRGEDLIARVYEALAANTEVFNKTVLVITYDEHGGFYDHVPPPMVNGVDPEDYYEKDGYVFKYNLLGSRVPAVVISPWVKRHTVDHTVLDHTSIYQTLRRSFCPNSTPSSDRDGTANTFSHVLNLSEPRVKRAGAEGSDADYPVTLEKNTVQGAKALQEMFAAPSDDSDSEPEVDDPFEMLAEVERP